MDVMKRIQAARRVVKQASTALERLKEDVKARKESLAAAQAALDKLIDDAAAGVQDLPLEDDE